MAIRIFGILIGLFTIALIILSLQDPYSLDLKSHSLNFKNIEAKELKAYDLDTNTTKSYYEANSWIRYKDKDVFNEFKTINEDFNLSSNSLSLFGKNLDKAVFEGNVSYADSNQTKILSQKVEFNPKEKILTTNVGFKALIGKNIINGNILNYDVKNKILNIQGVKAWLED